MTPLLAEFHVFRCFLSASTPALQWPAFCTKEKDAFTLWTSSPDLSDHSQHGLRRSYGLDHPKASPAPHTLYFMYLVFSWHHPDIDPKAQGFLDKDLMMKIVLGGGPRCSWEAKSYTLLGAAVRFSCSKDHGLFVKITLGGHKIIRS